MSTTKELETQLRKEKKLRKEAEKALEQEREDHAFTKERLTGSYDRNFSLRTGLINLSIDDIITLKEKQKELQKQNNM